MAGKKFGDVRTFFKSYRQFGIVLLTVLVALGLQLGGQKTAANWLLIACMVGNVIPLVWGMIQDLRHGTYGVDILAATAIITSVVMKEYWAGIIIVFMLTGGAALEDYAEARAKTELTALLDHNPTIAHVLRGRKIVDVKVSTIQTGDKLLVNPGEVVPVDAVIVEGSSSFDESSLTGESLPVERNLGEQLLSGSVNIEGAVTVRAIHSAEDSQFQQIIKLVNSASAAKAPFVRLADRYSIPFTIIAFAIAITAWVVSKDSLRFLQVMVVATPCPLILSAPIALISGMSRAAKHGIIIKNGAALERLAAIKSLAFDKTGTLTRGEPIVSNVTAFEPFTEEDILGLAAALEQSSTHVLAQAIVASATSHKLKIPRVKRVKELLGSGLEAIINGKDVVIGRYSLMQDTGVAMPKDFSVSAIKQTASYVAVDGQLAGVISFEDEVRPESQATLDELRSMGVKDFVMVTGDNKVTAAAVAKSLGITSFTSDALPKDKITAIQAIKNRPVGFVGDGVNDAPVLAAADVGIALGARGSTAASESADVVVMLDDIGRVATGIRIAKRTLFIAKQSILIGIGLSVVLMLIFATGKFKPIYGAIIQEFVDVIVIINALRAHGSWKKRTS